MRFSNDRATTVPSACVADDRAIAARCGDRGILETRLRKILAYFRRSLRIFPHQIHPPRAHGGKNVVETMFFAASDEESLSLPTGQSVNGLDSGHSLNRQVGISRRSAWLSGQFIGRPIGGRFGTDPDGASSTFFERGVILAPFADEVS